MFFGYHLLLQQLRLVHHQFYAGNDELLLVSKELVERALRHFQTLRDGVHRHIAYALLEEKLRGVVDDAALGSACGIAFYGSLHIGAWGLG